MWPRGGCWLQDEACQVSVVRVFKGFKRFKRGERFELLLQECGNGCFGLERQNLQTKPSGGKLTCPKHVIFMSKCLEVLTGGRSMPGKCLRDVALGQLAGCEMGLTLESEEGEVPHLRWSQAPPLPWPRPGSADLLVSSHSPL